MLESTRKSNETGNYIISMRGKDIGFYMTVSEIEQHGRVALDMKPIAKPFNVKFISNRRMQTLIINVHYLSG